MRPSEALSKSLIPLLIILTGIAIIVFNRTIASNAIENFRMFRIPLLFPEKNMPYYWIAIGVLTIFIGVVFLLGSLGL